MPRTLDIAETHFPFIPYVHEDYPAVAMHEAARLVAGDFEVRRGRIACARPSVRFVPFVLHGFSKMPVFIIENFIGHPYWFA
jgi:hypothetical protein